MEVASVAAPPVPAAVVRSHAVLDELWNSSWCVRAVAAVRITSTTAALQGPVSVQDHKTLDGPCASD